MEGPWWSEPRRKQVDVANYFVFQRVHATRLVADVGDFYLIEHPENFDEVAGEKPASIWQLPEMRELVEATKGTTWAVVSMQVQCIVPETKTICIERCTVSKFSIIIMAEI